MKYTCPNCGHTFQPAVEQPGLFDPPPPPVNGNRPGPVHASGHATEYAAARRNAPLSGKQRVRVLQAIVGSGEAGRTDYENEIDLGLKHSSVGTRRGELVEAGYVAKSDRTRTTDTGAEAIVWVATYAGISALKEVT